MRAICLCTGELSKTHIRSDGAVEVVDEEDGGVLKKRKFRSRAHANPLADPQFEYPVSPRSDTV
jgi:hypothetical protein